MSRQMRDQVMIAVKHRTFKGPRRTRSEKMGNSPNALERRGGCSAGQNHGKETGKGRGMRDPESDGPDENPEAT